MNAQQLIKEGLIKEVDENTYATNDSRIIRRTYTGRRQTTLKWKVDGIDFLYRNMYEAYYNLKY